MLILTLIIIVAVETGTVTDRVDVCACGGAGEYICILRRGTILTSTGCYGNLRTTGPGFVTGIDEMAMGHFNTVVIEKATLSCDSLGGLGQTTFVDGEACNKTATTTTSSRPPTLTDEPKARPPAIPDNGDDDDDDDDQNDDNDDHQYDDQETTTTTLTAIATTPATTTTQRTTARITTITIAAAYRDWLIVVGVGIVVAAGIVIVIRIRICRRSRTVPVQVAEVTSTSEEPQRTYVLREVPRSPRRRGATDAMETVALYAVDDDELYRDLFESSLRTVPEAPPVNAIPDIDSILSGEGDAFFDVNPSQYIGNTQRKPTGAGLQDSRRETAQRRNINASGDAPTKKAKVYPVIHKVDPKLVCRNGKRASSFVVPLRTPAGQGQRQGSTPRGQGVDSQEDLFEDRGEYFEQATPYGDTLYTPAPLIVPVCSQAVAGRMKLRSVSEISENYRSIFDFPYFNIVQSKVFDDVMYTDKPLVLCSPTGSGKTAVFEMAMVRLMTRSSSILNSSFKIVYMAPIKALCSERYNDWKDKLEPLGLKCMELTGDTEVDDFYRLQEVQVILTTPEKWDSMTRKWRDNAGVMQAICLFLVDEIHILNDPSRGSTVEAVITRMKTMSAAKARSNVDNGLPPLRFVAVSATITNIEDVAEWLGNSSSRAVFYKMDDSVRPVRLRKVVLGYHYAENKQSEFQFDLTLSYKLAWVIKTYSEDKPTLVFCSTRKSAQQSAETLSKDMKSSFITSAQHRQQLNNLSFHIKDAKLRDLLCKGIGYHHAGMDLQDRKNIEEAFAAGNLPVLVSTSTLAMGVNLPAHLVIIKSTMFYNLGMYQEYSDTQVLQMIGRAGRPQFDTSATAVIMTKNQTKIKYENLLNGTQLIESSLHKNLIEHLNAEIVLHTISDISVAVEWLKYTFLYIRVFKNPKHYGLPLGLTRGSIEKRLQDMCMKDLKQLQSLNMICMDEENLDVKPQESGKLMARYCISYKTMELFFGLTGAETVAELVTVVSKCQEFMDIQLRTNEKRTLNTLNRDKNRMTIRYPMQGKIKTTDMKVNCLIQTAFGNLMLQDFGLQQDTGRIFRAGTRITRCLVELLWHKQDFKCLLSAIQLCKCFKAKLWEDSKFVSKQLEGIGPALSNALVNAGITTFERIEAMNPREIELIVNRHPPFGNQVRDSVSNLPKYELVIEQMTRYAVNTSEIVITIQLSNRETLKDKTSTNHTCTLIIGDQDNNVVYKQRIMDVQLLKVSSWSKKLEIKHAAKGPDLFIHYISQDWVGLDVECTFTPNYLGGKRITSTGPAAVSPKTEQPAREPTKLDTVVPCNHLCHNKQLCAHECCKIGVSARKRQQRSHENRYKTCGRAVQNHINDLHSRVASLQQTPVQFKRPKLEFKGSAGPGPNIDLSKFAYSATKPQVHDPRNNTPSNRSADAGQGQTWDDLNVGQRSRSLSNRGSDWMELDMFRQQREHFFTAEADQSYIEDDQASLPDLNTDYQAPNFQDEQYWDEQQNQGPDDFAHETDYGYFYVNCDDMQKTPADWDDHITQEPSGCSGKDGKIAKTKQPKNNRGAKTIPCNVPATRKPLFKNRRPNHLNVARTMKNNYVFDAYNNNAGLQNVGNDNDIEIIENDGEVNDSELNDNENEDNLNDLDLIDNYESDEEQTTSRWTNYTNSQSSEDTDYLNQPFPDKLQSRSMSRSTNRCQEMGSEAVSRNKPGLNKNLKGILKQPLPSVNAQNTSDKQNCRNSLNSVTERISMKPGFLNNKNGVEAMRRNNIPENFRSLGMLQSKSAKKENMDWNSGKAGVKRCFEGVKQNHWEDVKTAQLAGLDVKRNEQQQSRKFGQVLAWVSNSQNKHENRSPTDWDDWGSDSDLLAEADKTTVANDENLKRPSGVDKPHIDADVEIKIAKKDSSLKPTGFSSFFSKDVDQNKTDAFINIFDGLF